MKHPLSLENLVHFLQSQHVVVRDMQIDMLRRYHSLLLSWSQRQNLYAKGEKNHLIERHFLPSFYFWQLIKEYTEKKIIDIGTGAGFPGVILQIMNPEISMTMIDSSRKKCLFLQEVNETLQLGAHIKYSRVENINIDDQTRFDIAVARFLGDLNNIWRWSAPLLKPSGILLVQKGGARKQNIPLNAKHMRYWQPESSWINISPALSSKFIIEVQKA